MPPTFGTSGLRGLVTELTDDLVTDYVRAFATALPVGAGVAVGWDLRPSSPRIAQASIAALRDLGLCVQEAGALPTPALAFGAMAQGMGAVMITGSHIPADRNGLKFYTPEGEILKADEARIQAALGQVAQGGAGPVEPVDFAARYAARYVSAYGPEALAGLRIGVYQHSSVARDIMVTVLEQLGAQAVPLGWSEDFIPVDTEAVDPATRLELAKWCADHSLDALISTDGDADRPMVTDATGQVMPGDVLGPLTAQALGAARIVTPVSSNSCVDQMGFAEVARTKIGSPYVIAGMQAQAGQAVVGYEANGGFLLGFEAQGPAGPLAPLMTRDCLLPILAPLALARARGLTLAQLGATLPQRFTAADRVVGIETPVAQAFLAQMTEDPATRAAFFAGLPPETGLDLTDGLRVRFGDEVVHLRPSGNAPEFRCYTEAASPSRAAELLAQHMQRLATQLGSA
jgi:phosphomannomutase